MSHTIFKYILHCKNHSFEKEKHWFYCGGTTGFYFAKTTGGMQDAKS
jgi:hypothetical protein